MVWKNKFVRTMDDYVETEIGSTGMIASEFDQQAETIDELRDTVMKFGII